MRIVVQVQGWVSVDNHARRVADSLDLGPGVETLAYDTDQSFGYLYYNFNTTVNVQERDLKAEEVENNRRRLNNLPPLEEAIYKTVAVQRPPQFIENDYARVEPFYTLWEQTSDVPPESQPDPELVAKLEAAETENNLALNDSVGGAESKTFRELRDMSRAELRAWFDANFTTDAQLRRLLRWIFIYLVRRL